jgi:hypothetical protein
LTALVVLAATIRILPHSANFGPIGAIALFGGASFHSKRSAFLVPWAAMLLGDVVLGFHLLMPVVYGSFAVNVLLGRWLRTRRQLLPIALATLAGSLQFFIITNFACWLAAYPHTLTGLCSCYVAAIPFFQNTLLGDAVFTTVLFGAMAVAEHGFPVFREQRELAAT